MKIDDELGQVAEYVIAQLREHKMKVTTAESCTGGLISAAMTSVAGSSEVFDRAFITYSNEAKSEMLGVAEEVIRDQGAVSSQTAMAMAAGALDNSDAQISVAVTGIAGPGGGSKEKPVGTVFVAVAGPEGMFVEELQLGDISRDAIRSQTAMSALEMIVAFGLPDDEDGMDAQLH